MILTVCLGALMLIVFADNGKKNLIKRIFMPLFAVNDKQEININLRDNHWVPCSQSKNTFGIYFRNSMLCIISSFINDKVKTPWLLSKFIQTISRIKITRCVSHETKQKYLEVLADEKQLYKLNLYPSFPKYVLLSNNSKNDFHKIFTENGSRTSSCINLKCHLFQRQKSLSLALSLSCDSNNNIPILKQICNNLLKTLYTHLHLLLLNKY